MFSSPAVLDLSFSTLPQTEDLQIKLWRNLAQQPGISVLILARVESFNEKQLKTLFTFLGDHCQIQRLILDGNDFTDSILESLKLFLKKNRSCSHISLQHNALSANFIEALGPVLLQAKSLQSVFLHGNPGVTSLMDNAENAFVMALKQRPEFRADCFFEAQVSAPLLKPEKKFFKKNYRKRLALQDSLLEKLNKRIHLGKDIMKKEKTIKDLVEKYNADGFSSIHVACAMKNIKALKSILACNKKLSFQPTRDATGRTDKFFLQFPFMQRSLPRGSSSLHFAVGGTTDENLEVSKEMVDLLLESGNNPHILNAAKCKAVDYCMHEKLRKHVEARAQEFMEVSWHYDPASSKKKIRKPKKGKKKHGNR